MGDVNIPAPEPGAIGARVAELIASGHELYATTVSGSSSGRVRRPTLFVIAAVGTAIAPFVFIGAVVSVIAIVLLAITDTVVEL